MTLKEAFKRLCAQDPLLWGQVCDAFDDEAADAMGACVQAPSDMVLISQGIARAKVHVAKQARDAFPRKEALARPVQGV
jgi:hypothetical protein